MDRSRATDPLPVTTRIVTLSSRNVAAALAVVLLLCLTPGAAGAARPRPSAPASRPDFLWGVSTPGGPTDLSQVRALAREVGSAPRAVLYFQAWTAGAFDAAAAQSIADGGSVPVLTWEPWDPARGAVQPEYALDRIAAGDHDAHIRTYARDVARWGGRLLLRFAHEMNGTWYPWSAAAGGGSPAAHAAAWRHVHRLFQEEGATAVEWVWAANVSFPGSTPLASIYPGDDVVDWVGVDGYNGGTALDWGGWTGYQALFGPTLDELAAITSRPVLITETASAEQGGDKAAWIADALRRAGADSRIAGLLWFDHQKEADWRIHSSRRSARAFVDGVRALVG